MVRELRRPIGGQSILPVDPPLDIARKFGIDPAHIDIFTIPLDDARTNVRFPKTGTFIWAIDATSLIAKLSIRFQNQTNSLVPFTKGQAIGGLKFSELFLTNEAQAGATITFFVLREMGERIDFVNPSLAASTVTLEKPTDLNTVADVALVAATATQIAAADATRHELLLSNPSSNTAIMRIGDANVGAARGVVLEPGQSMVLTVTAAVWGYSVPGESIAVAEILD